MIYFSKGINLLDKRIDSSLLYCKKSIHIDRFIGWGISEGNLLLCY